jgi:hypothetical protein
MTDLVPLLEHNRNTNWSAARQQAFLEALADSGSVVHACRVVAMSRTAAYRLRRHPDAADFRAAWDMALAEAWAQVEHVALERALQGEEEVIERAGVTEVVRRRPCDARLLVRMLDRADARAAGVKALQRQVAELRAVIDAMPDRRGWLPEPAEPRMLDQVERLPPPLRVIAPADGWIDHAGTRPRIRTNL